jgi:hypothetical protein
VTIGPGRFGGEVEALGGVHITALLDWLQAIPWAAWPQQSPGADGRLRPAMVNDPRWHDFGRVSAPIGRCVLQWAPGGVIQQRLLSVVMPGHAIPEHVDKEPPTWWGRVHVPLLSNPQSVFCVGGRAHHLRAGRAYLVNTEAPHSVRNDGETPRVHLMFDVGAA